MPMQTKGMIGLLKGEVDVEAAGAAASANVRKSEKIMRGKGWPFSGGATPPEKRERKIRQLPGIVQGNPKTGHPMSAQFPVLSSPPHSRRQTEHFVLITSAGAPPLCPRPCGSGRDSRRAADR